MAPKSTKIRLMYEQFLKAHAEAHPLVQRQNQLKSAQKLWNSVKDDQEKYDETMRDFKIKASQQKSKSYESWANLFKKPRGKDTNSTPTTSSATVTPTTSTATSAAVTPTTSVPASAVPTLTSAAVTTSAVASTSKAPNGNEVIFIRSQIVS